MPEQTVLLSATARILRAIIRVLLRRGIPYPIFSELARWTYADLAAKEFALPERKQSNTRVAILTGLSRKEVLRLRRKEIPCNQAGMDRYNRGSRIVTAWLREPGFQDAAGHPLPLPFDSAGGSFSELVSRFGGDVTPRAVLDELCHSKTVAVDDQQRISLCRRGFIPSGPEARAEILHLLGTDAAALIETIDHNLMAPDDQLFFQRKVSYRGLATSDIKTIRAFATRQSQQLLEEVDRLMAKSTADQPDGTEPNNEIMLGIYWHQRGEQDE